MPIRLLVLALFLIPALTIVGCQPRHAGGGGGVDHEPISTPSGGDIEVPVMPADVEAFRAWRDTVATDPRGGAAAFVVALLAYANDANTGLAYLTVQTDRKFLAAEGTRGPPGYKGMRINGINLRRYKDRIAAKPYIARSYVLGTSPGNKYTIPAGPFTISTRREQDVGKGRVKVWVFSTGADSARPITLQQNSRGIWKAYEWSSLQVGVRPPHKAAPKDDF